MLSVDNIRISYGGSPVIEGLSFNITQGEIACLLGASGCGKTSVLRAIAGFQKLSDGVLSLGGQRLSSTHTQLPPEKRDIGMVFQEHALFPHLTVRENIRFGLVKLAPEEQQSRCTDMLELTRLAGLENRYPHQLSGGQQQRVALARAMATHPRLLLLDEPFSNLDAELRNQLALEVRDILTSRDTSAILVTHDQAEAFTFAEHVGVIHQGTLQQWDTPHNLYHQPTNRMVASFIGRGALVPGEVNSTGSVTTELGEFAKRGSQFEVGQQVDVLLRPEDVVYDDTAALTATVTAREFSGATTIYRLRLGNGLEMESTLTRSRDFQPGDQVSIGVCVNQPSVFRRP